MKELFVFYEDIIFVFIFNYFFFFWTRLSIPGDDIWLSTCQGLHRPDSVQKWFVRHEPWHSKSFKTIKSLIRKNKACWFGVSGFANRQIIEVNKTERKLVVAEIFKLKLDD